MSYDTVVSLSQPRGVGHLFATDDHVVISIIMIATATAGCDGAIVCLVL